MFSPIPAAVLSATPVRIPADAPTFDTHELPTWAAPTQDGAQHEYALDPYGLDD